MAGLRLDGPLAELDAARVPFRPVGTVWVCLDANDQADGGAVEALREPVGCGFEDVGVDVGVDAAPGQEDQVAEVIGPEHWFWQRVVGVQDLGECGVEVSDEIASVVVAQHLVDEAWVVFCPGSFHGPQVLAKLA